MRRARGGAPPTSAGDEAVGARDPVATIRADGLQSVASRRGARAAVVTPGRADQQVSSQGDVG